MIGSAKGEDGIIAVMIESNINEAVRKVSIERGLAALKKGNSITNGLASTLVIWLLIATEAIASCGAGACVHIAGLIREPKRLFPLYSVGRHRRIVAALYCKAFMSEGSY